MKNVRGFVLGLALGLGLALSGLAFAQNANDQTKKDSCCATASCCCKGDSCPMMKDSKDKSGKHECCCCGDSCDMKNMKDMKMKDTKDMKNKP